MKYLIVSGLILRIYQKSLLSSKVRFLIPLTILFNYAIGQEVIISPTVGKIVTTIDGVGDGHCSHQITQFKWCYNQWGIEVGGDCSKVDSPKTHCLQGENQGNGIDGALDNYSWDANLSGEGDNAMAVYSIYPGTITRVNLELGEILVRHNLPNSPVRYSSYMHMKDVEGGELNRRDFFDNEYVSANYPLGTISNVGVSDIHLHFSWYEEDLIHNKLRSMDAIILENCVNANLGQVINAGLYSNPNNIRVHFEITEQYQEYISNITSVRNVKIGENVVAKNPPPNTVSQEWNQIIVQRSPGELNKYFFDLNIQPALFENNKFYDIHFQINGHYSNTDVVDDLQAYGKNIVFFSSCNENIDSEPNGSFNTAQRIYNVFSTKRIIETIDGNIFTGWESDYYEFKVNEPGKLAAAVVGSNVSDIQIEFYNHEKRFIPSETKVVSSGKAVVLSCIQSGETGTYYVKIYSSDRNSSCTEYKLGLGWGPGAEICTASSANKNSQLKSQVSCTNCNEIEFSIANISPTFSSENSTYKLECHLIGDGSKYYNVFAVDTQTNDIVGTPLGNISAKSSNNGNPNVVIRNIPCGSGNIVLRAERVDNPEDCFYQLDYTIPPCSGSNKSIVSSWPGLQGQCFTYNDNNTITWSSTNVDKVNIQLCPLGEECYYIAQGVQNTGSYSWSTPSYDGEFFVKITDYINDLICDEGSIFEIDNNCNDNDCDAPILTNLSPTSGKTFNPSESFYITYEASNMNYSCQLRDYEIWFSGSSSFPSNNTVKFSSESSRVGPFTGLNQIRFYWKVRAINRDGEDGAWSPTHNFVVSNSSALFDFVDADLCSSSNHSNSSCTNDVNSFALNTQIFAACDIHDIRERMRIKVVWRDNSNNELFTDWSNWTSSGDLNFSTEFTPALAGSYKAEFYIEQGVNEIFQVSKSFSVTTGSSSSGNGNLRLLDLYSNDEVNNLLTIEQGGHFIIRAEGEYSGDLGSLPNRELITKAGFFIKRIRSSNVSSSWYKFIGEEPLDFGCPSFSLCPNGTYTDRGSNQLQIPYDVEPGDYYILGLIDYLKEWNETNESDQSEYMSIRVTPKCDDIFPIQDSEPTTRSIKIAWSENANVSSTDIRYRKSGETDWTIVTNFTNGDILNGLEPCTLYEQQVLAHCPGDDSNWSRTNGMKTKCEFPCLPPDDRSERPNYESARVYWGELERVYLYEVRWKKSGTFTWLYDDNKGCCFDGIPNLEPGTLYEWQIRTECPDNEFSNWSSTRTFTTNSSCTDGIQTGLETGVDCGGNCPPCDCEQEYHVLDYTPTDNSTIEVMKEIEVSSSLGFNNNTVLKAGEAITLSGLSEVQLGSQLEININNCEND